MTISRPRPTRAGVRAAVGLLLCSVIPTFGPHVAIAREIDPVDAATAGGARVSAALPMSFEPNLGQADPSVDFVARGREYAVMVTGREVVLALGVGANARDERPRLLRVGLEGASATARAVGERRLPGTSNYLRGTDASKWLRDVPTFGAVRYEQAYRGVDFIVYGTERRLEYDFVVAPGADPSQIRLKFGGVEEARVDEHGDLVLRTKGGEVRQPRAAVYQSTPAGRRDVASRYVAGDDGSVRLDLADYDRAAPLVVDPVIVYADFLGGSQSAERAEGVAVDASGAIYVTGTTTAVDYPVTPGAFDSTYEPLQNGGSVINGFVSKLSPDGTSLVYSTFLGGQFGASPAAIAVDATGRAVVAGQTISPNYPTTAGAFDGSIDGADGFVTKLTADGSALVFSTLLGGTRTESITDLALGPDGSVYVGGNTDSLDFPTTPGAFDRGFNSDSSGKDAFVTKLSPNGASLAYSTYLGGFGSEQLVAVAVSPTGEIAVGGTTSSAFDFPLTPGAFDSTSGNPAPEDGFVTRLNASGSGLVFSTFLGGGTGYQDKVNDLAIDAAGAVYAAGGTDSTDFPTTPGALDLGASDPTGRAGFVVKFASNGSVAYSARVGGGAFDELDAIAVAPGGVVAAGSSSSSDFPTTAGAFDTTANGRSDAVVVKLNDAGTALVFSTVYGGVRDEVVTGMATDTTGRLVVCGWTDSNDLPMTAGSAGPAFRGGTDAFAFRLSAAGAAVDRATYLSGLLSPDSNLPEAAKDVAVDASGAAYVTGLTYAVNFPVTPGAYDPTQNLTPGDDFSGEAFVTKLAPDGASLVYSTFLGGHSYDEARAIALGPGGEAYVVGVTRSSDFPTTPGAFDTTLANPADPFAADAFVAKLSASGSSLVYGSYLGGGEDEVATGVAVGPAGTVFVAGDTYSSDFPTTPGAFDTVADSDSYYDGFALQLNATGSAAVYSTYLGGTRDEHCYSVAADATGAAYVVGGTGSQDFPVTPGAFDTTFAGMFVFEGFVAKIAPGGAALAYATFLGGTREDTVDDVVVDASGAVFVAGSTKSLDFPTTPGAFDTTHNSDGLNGDDVFVTKLAPNGASLVYSTFVGSERSDMATGIAVDASGRAYVTGRTDGLGFPVTPGAYDTILNDGYFFDDDAFAFRLSAAGSALEYATYLGSDDTEIGRAVAVDSVGNLYVVGDTESERFVNTGFGSRDRSSAFVLKLTPVAIPSTDSPGVYVGASGAWFLRNTNSPGNANLVFTYGPAGAGLVPLSGDWNGDGVDTPGLYNPANGAFFLKNTNGPGNADVVFTFGGGGAGLVPMAGDWDGDGDDTVGLYVTATGTFFLRSVNAPGPADIAFAFGVGGDGVRPIKGDWNGDGTDTVGLYDVFTGAFFLRNTNAPGPADITLTYGPQFSTPLAGDWDEAGGGDRIGIYDANQGVWLLRKTNSNGPADLQFGYGPVGGVTPLVGNWDGQ